MVGTYHHLVATFDGTRAELYLDGANVDGGTTTGSLIDNAGPLRLGATSSGSNPLLGALDEVAIYDYALPANVVAEHAAL